MVCRYYAQHFKAALVMHHHLSAVTKYGEYFASLIEVWIPFNLSRVKGSNAATYQSVAC